MLPASAPVAGPADGPGVGSPIAGSPAVWKAIRILPASAPVLPVLPVAPVLPVTVTDPGPPSRQLRPETLVIVKEP